jgi:two-component system sensor histidine kinase VanS
MIENYETVARRRLYTHIRKEALLLLTILLGLYVGGWYIFNKRIWFGTEFLYQLLQPVKRYGIYVIVAFCVIRIIWLLADAYRNTFHHLEEVLEATQDIYEGNDKKITLSPELRDVETQMNNIMLGVRESQRRAQEAEQRKNDLVVYLAHDLKTPLTSVIGYLTLLNDEKQISPELQDKYLAIALDKSERLEDLINEFFEITRFNLTNLTLEKTKINLTRMLEQTVFEFEPMLREKNLKCSLNVKRDMLLTCDAEKMERVFENLLRNAVNYSYDDTTIDLVAKEDIEGISIEVSNHGDTIPPEKIERIFEQFYRVDSARRSHSGGSGLGLAIAKEIVELHGGTISASSESEIIRFQIHLSQDS